MKRIIILSMLILSTLSNAAIIEFEQNGPVKAQEVNSNFDHIQTLMQAKNYPIVFQSFQQGTVINQDQFEAEFDKVRAKGIDVDSLGVLFIKSVGLNTAFAQMAAGASNLNDFPMTSNFNITLNEDTQASGIVSFTNNQGSSSFSVTSNATHGSLTLNPSSGLYLYIPIANYHGSDYFSYIVTDGTNASSPATASITVTSVNDIPVASAQTLSTQEDIAKPITLVAIDPDNDTLTYSIVSQPSNGTISGLGSSIIYIPVLNYNGSDSFTFKVNDGTVDSNTSTISLNISAVNDAPSVNALASFNVAHNSNYAGTLTGTDVEGSSLSAYTITQTPVKGTVSVNPNTGAFTYTSTTTAYGADLFKVTVSDGSLTSLERQIDLAVICGSSFHEESSSCLSNTRTCLITNGTGSQNWVSGTTYSTCLTTSCSLGYEAAANNESCIPAWPVGNLGNVTIGTGQTVTLSAGDLADYNNLTIDSGGLLNITGASGGIAVIGVRGNLINNGTIRARGGSFNTQTFSKTTPLGDSVSYTSTQNNAGAGGGGGNNVIAGGAAGNRGIGGGGGAGPSWGGGGIGGTNAGNGASGTQGPGSAGVVGAAGIGGGTGAGSAGGNASGTHGGAGGAGASGGGGGGTGQGSNYGGGGGAGGGYKGLHGLGLYIYCLGTVSGSGQIQLHGSDGFNGGKGGNGAESTSSHAGGGGGGGAGGNGGRLWIKSPNPATVNPILTQGIGGTGGARGSVAPAPYNGREGGNGSNGNAGSYTYTDLTP